MEIEEFCISKTYRNKVADESDKTVKNSDVLKNLQISAIIKFFPKLQKIGLVDNNIKEKDAEDIQKKIKEKYGNREIKIMVKEGKDEKF